MPKYRESTWADFSSKFCKLQGLPEGFHLRVFPKGINRHKRNDFLVQRLSLNKKNVGWLGDDQRVTALRDEAQTLLADDALPTGVKIALHDAAGREVIGGTALATLRREKEPSSSEKLSQDQYDEMDYLRPLVTSSLSNLEDGISEPDYSVVCAVLRGLKDRYGKDHVERLVNLV